MAIENQVDHEQLCVYTNCTGIMKKTDVDDYMSRIWTVSSHFGYNELFDTTQGDWSEFDFDQLFDIAKTASLLTAIDPGSKLAWVVSNEEIKNLTQLYAQSKAMITTQVRHQQAFFNRQQALGWLGVTE
ncbi:MAG: hypothetical protein OEY36_04215 [Gammaproteobacteria bacterium]|nr:hypothetical protein [Gammaproteobacteria bacterium]